MILWSILASASLAIAGALLLYMVSPQQLLLSNGQWPARRRAWPGTLCVLLSLALLWPRMGSAEAIATWLTLLMLVWTLAPFMGAWRARARAKAGAA